MGAPLPEKWNPENEPARVVAGAVTLVEGSSFCICTPGGDLGGAGPNGVFFRDTRILSRWDLRVDGELPDPLTAMVPDPYPGHLPRPAVPPVRPHRHQPAGAA
jgi:hypothetical protein